MSVVIEHRHSDLSTEDIKRWGKNIKENVKEAGKTIKSGAADARKKLSGMRHRNGQASADSHAEGTSFIMPNGNLMRQLAENPNMYKDVKVPAVRW